MNLKLGPALKLCAHINALKDTWTVSIPPLKEWICVALDEPKTTTKKHRADWESTDCSFFSWHHCRGFQLWRLLQLLACLCYILTTLSAPLLPFYCSDCSRIHLFQNGFQSSFNYLSIKTTPLHFHYYTYKYNPRVYTDRLLPPVLEMKFDVLLNTILVLTDGKKTRLLFMNYLLLTLWLYK